MPPRPPPNEALAELAAVLGEDNVRTLARTFLRDFPKSFHELSNGEPKNRHRLAHSMKSNSRLMGAHELSRQMADLEDRFSGNAGADLSSAELAQISARFEAIASQLRAFIGDE